MNQTQMDIIYRHFADRDIDWLGLHNNELRAWYDAERETGQRLEPPKSGSDCNGLAPDYKAVKAALLQQVEQ